MQGGELLECHAAVPASKQPAWLSARIDGAVGRRDGHRVALGQLEPLKALPAVTGAYQTAAAAADVDGVSIPGVDRQALRPGTVKPPSHGDVGLEVIQAAEALARGQIHPRHLGSTV